VQYRSFVCVLICLFAAGCGPGNLGKVSGTVTRDGQPVTGGSVMFSPVAAGGKAGAGSIGPDGKYEISTHGDLDGAVIGKHSVSVSLELPADGQPVDSPPAFEFDVKGGSNVFDIELSK